MNAIFRPRLAAWLAGAALIGMMAGGAEARPRAGLLECNVSSGIGFIVTSNRALSCVLTPRRGPRQYYVGTIRNFGLDLGFTSGGRFVWAVFTAGSALPPFALAGEFVGASGGASFGGGVTANVLVGGNNRSISLQPLSLGVQAGVNLSAGVGALSLEPSAPPPGR
ncbi:conserved exported hypothetical protein [Methylocella tundrae]|uniref:DUF992 domain-containing protein n=1 Tax=Methylocella tundrae TaxID=227605 RepID=A0A8B6M502_METTU|nr:DUF992 domain-containing protein [Methylocella tundrae]VTZ49390.1 conserved exported hypothetical protein [Methylocella tundrae]